MKRFAPALVALLVLAPEAFAAAPSGRLSVVTERFRVPCPAGTVRAVKRLGSDRMELRVGIEQPRWQVFCRDGTGAGHGPVVLVRHSYRDNSDQLARRRYFLAAQLVWQGSFAAGVPDGRWRQFNRHGEVLGTNRVRAGDGRWQAWRSTGVLAATGRIRGGERDGPWRFLMADGRPAAQGGYRDGKLDGRWRRWHGNGEVRSDISYRRGRRHGLTTEWHPSGEKRMEGRFEAGVRHGRWSFWNARGELLGVNTLERDSGHWIDWRDNGHKSQEGVLARGQRVGRWFTYDQTGRKIAEGDYRKGVRISKTWVRYDRDGKVHNKRKARIAGVLGRISGARIRGLSVGGTLRVGRGSGAFRGAVGGIGLRGSGGIGLRGSGGVGLRGSGAGGIGVGKIGTRGRGRPMQLPEVKLVVRPSPGWMLSAAAAKPARLTMRMCAIGYDIRRLRR